MGEGGRASVGGARMERFAGGSQPTESVLLASGDWLTGQFGVISTRYRFVL